MSFVTVAPAQQLNNSVITGAQALLNAMIKQPTRWFNLIWNNPDQANLSPDKAWAALGTQAVQVHQAFLGLVTFVNGVSAGSLTLTEPTDWTLTQNQDGSITAVKTS